MSADTLPLVVSWFETAAPTGPALGDPERTTWGEFASIFEWRREGEKDGPNVVPARFTLEPDGRCGGANSGCRHFRDGSGNENDSRTFS